MSSIWRRHDSTILEFYQRKILKSSAETPKLKQLKRDVAHSDRAVEGQLLKRQGIFLVPAVLEVCNQQLLPGSFAL